MSNLVERLRGWIDDETIASDELDRTIAEAAARIEALEALNSELVTQCDTHARQKMAFKDRIEQLEAALEKIIRHPAGLYEEQADIASAALAPEQDK